jgi:hypothetical protein
MFFLAEFMGLAYYYTFYRVLFESISSWSLFFLFQALHLLSEWILYPLRGSLTVTTCLQSLQQYPFFAWCSLIPKETNHADWLNFIALDFGVRIIVMIASALGILLLVLTIDCAPWIDNALRQHGHEIERNAGFLLLAVIFEMINAIIINYVFFLPWKIDVGEKVRYVFDNPRFAGLTVFIGTCLFINPIYAFTEDNIF